MNIQTFFPVKTFIKRACIIITVLLIFNSCKKQNVEPGALENQSAFRFNNKGIGNGNLSAEMVLRWNQAAIYVVTHTQQVVPNPPIPPFIDQDIMQW